VIVGSWLEVFFQNALGIPDGLNSQCLITHRSESYRVGDACKAPQKSTHLRPPILTLRLEGTGALNVSHRDALKVQIRPLGGRNQSTIQTALAEIVHSSSQNRPLTKGPGGRAPGLSQISANVSECRSETDLTETVCSKVTLERRAGRTV
jgi:hypothetical protein